MHLPNQSLRKPDKLSQGAHSQTSYPKVQWENTLHKRGLQKGTQKERERERERGGGEREIEEKEGEVTRSREQEPRGT